LIAFGELLLRQTEADAIEWNATDNENDFVFSGTKGSALVRQWRDYDDTVMYKLAILNSRGTEVESLHSEWESEGLPREHNETLERLWEAARRSALDIHQILESLMDEVEHPEKLNDRPGFSDEPPF